MLLTYFNVVIGNKVYRNIFQILQLALSFIRIIHLKMKYSKIEIDYCTYIGAKTFISCEDNSSLIIKSSFISNGICSSKIRR